MSEQTIITGVAASVTLQPGIDCVVCADDADTLRRALPGIEIGVIRKVVIQPGPEIQEEAAPEGPTPEGFASMFDGREYGEEVSNLEEAALRNAGMVAVFGYSDDCTEFRGAIHDEVGLGELRVTPSGKLLNDDQNAALASLVADGLATDAKVGIINASYGSTGHTYLTSIPHACFNVVDDNYVFCRGIVFRLSDLK